MFQTRIFIAAWKLAEKTDLWCLEAAQVPITVGTYVQLDKRLLLDPGLG